MSDDPLAEAVAALMKEEQTLDPRLERLARGELSDDERRALEEEAKSNAELSQAMALFTPLSPELRQKLAGNVRPKVVPLRRIVAIASLAAAAAIGGLFVAQEPAMPAYVLNARAGDAEWRGEAPRKREVRSDSTIELVLTPARPAEGEIAAKLFVLEQGVLHQMAVRAQISEEGAVRWIDRAEVIAGGRTGAITLIAKVGRAGASEDAWQSMPLDVEIRAAGGAP